MPTLSDYLQLISGSNLQPNSGKWVRLVNNITLTAYISTATTDSNGLFTINNVPTGLYTVYTGPSNTGPWTGTGDNNYVVAPAVGYDAVGSVNNLLQVELKGDGSDESATINAALAAAGARRVLLSSPTNTASFASSLLMKNEVWLDLGGITLKWTGAIAGSLFTSGGTDPLLRARLTGGRVDPQTTATGFGIDWHSPQFCVVDLEFLSGSATFTAMRWAADAANASGYSGTRNAVYNTVSRFLTATVGTGIRFTGQATGAVTLNRFDAVNISAASVVGIVASAAGFVDTNNFGQVRIQLGANNAIGVDLGENNTSTNIYNWNFQNLSTDDPTNAFTGLTGIALRNASKLKVENFYPQFTGGTTINTGVSTSYLIRDTYAAGGGSIFTKNVGLMPGPHAVQLPAYVATYTPDPTLGDIIAMTLTGAITVNLPAAQPTGTEFTFQWIQDATGGRVVTYNGGYKVGTAPAIVTTGSTATIDRFYWDGGLYRLISRVTGE